MKFACDDLRMRFTSPQLQIQLQSMEFAVVGLAIAYFGYLS